MPLHVFGINFTAIPARGFTVIEHSFCYSSRLMCLCVVCVGGGWGGGVRVLVVCVGGGGVRVLVVCVGGGWGVRVLVVCVGVCVNDLHQVMQSQR